VIVFLAVIKVIAMKLEKFLIVKSLKLEHRQGTYFYYLHVSDGVYNLLSKQL